MKFRNGISYWYFLKLTLLCLFVSVVKPNDINANIMSDEFCQNLSKIWNLESESFKSITGKKSGDTYAATLSLPGAEAFIKKSDGQTQYIARYPSTADSLQLANLMNEFEYGIDDCFPDEIIYSMPGKTADSLQIISTGSYTAAGDGMNEPAIFLEMKQDELGYFLQLSLIGNADVTYYFMEEMEYIDVFDLSMNLDIMLGSFQRNVSDILDQKVPPVQGSQYSSRMTLNTNLPNGTCYYEEGDSVSPRIRCVLSESDSQDQIKSDYYDLKHKVFVALGNYYLNRELDPDIKGMPASIELAYVEYLFRPGLPLIKIKIVEGETKKFAAVVDIIKS